MSKAKNRPNAKMQKRAPRFFRPLKWFVRGRVEEVKSHLRDPDSVLKDLPQSIRKDTAAAAEDLAWVMVQNLHELHGVSVDQRTGVRVVATLAVEMGFAMALYRFADALEGESELAQWRGVGQRKGHESQSRARIKRAEQIRAKWREIEAAGGTPSNEMVATAMKCSVSTVIRAFRQKGSLPKIKNARAK